MTRALLAIVVAAAVAHAAPRATARVDADGALQVDLLGLDEVPASSIVLNVDDAKWLVPARVAPADHPVALALVMQVSRPWIERDSFAIGPMAEHALRGFRASPGSTLAIVTYHQVAELRLPSTPFAALPPDLLGTFASHQGKTGNAMVAGIALALAELAKSDAKTKELVVIGDGSDALPDQKPRMRALVEAGIAAGVRMHAIVLGYGAGAADDLPDEGLEPTVASYNWPADAEKRLHAVLAIIPRHQRITFAPGTLPADGASHALRLEIGAFKIPVALEAPAAPAAPLPMPKLPSPPSAPRIPWFLVGAIVAFTLILLSLPLLLIRHRRAVRRR